MRHFSLSLFISCALFATCLDLTQATTPNSRSEIVYNEAKATFDLVMRKAMDDPDEKIPAFSSKALPAWAANATALETFYRPQDKEIKVLTTSYRRTWTYRVASGVLGRSLDAIGENELVIEVVNAPAGVSWEGVKKNGLIKKRSTPPRP